MKKHFVLPLGLGALLLALIAFGTGMLVTAAPNGQDGEDLATPTLFPVENAAYELSVVGGEDVTLTFEAQEIDGFSISETTATSEYPNGMTFTVNAESPNGEIVDVILFIRFDFGSGTRVVAEWDDEAGAWVARPWSAGGRPPWSRFDIYWRVRDETDVFVDTAPHTIDYFDPAHTWFRSESDHMVLYWYGFGEDVAYDISQTMADRIEGTVPRWEAGFGSYLSYKPIVIIFPDRDAMNAMYGEDGVANPRVAGFTSSDLGMSVQVLREAGTPDALSECIYAPEDPVAYWTMERRISTIYGTTAHELTHLHQFELAGGRMGFEWWSEGQAEWFANTGRQYDMRLRHLATLQDLPSLTTTIGSDLAQADGCRALSYLVGPSFINYLLANYGGVETHGEIMRLIRDEGYLVFDAIEAVTGESFFDLENDWRVYLGFEPFSLADIDPASALEPAVDPVAAVGDVVTLPAMPPLPAVYADPSPTAATTGQCFANMDITILTVGSLDGVNYYEVDCMGQIGWMPEELIAGQ
ncbi:MAG: hypothetical protein GYB65_01710 [Chloroflexi bacterium]|nr:hypothetical protein [Chloroflexota bacterium]